MTGQALGWQIVRLVLCSAVAILTAMGQVQGSPERMSETIRLDSGIVSGVASRVESVRAFLGIPYAAPPVGQSRWKPPQPPSKWDGVRAADKFGPQCMQPSRPDVPPAQFSEDCLYLNVWTPADSADEQLPVMVWIHGGSFIIGSASDPDYDGQELARKGVVVVTVNYRLGVFGFMAHPELTRESGHGSSGNYGLMDMVAALEWVKVNIAAFGGDPKRVTLFGQSSGSMSIAILMASPRAVGLFHGAIGHSNGLSNDYRNLSRREQSYSTRAFPNVSLSELRAMPSEQLWKKASGNAFIDGWLLPDNPTLLFEQGKASDVPLLVVSRAPEK